VSALIDDQLTGIENLDEVTQGLPQNALTVIVGAPGCGKTTLAMQCAAHAARTGRDVLFLTAFSVSNEKLMQHMDGFTFFDPTVVGTEINMLSLKALMHLDAESMVRTIFSSAVGKKKPLLILDGYRGFRSVMGSHAAQQFLSILAAQLPYFDASCIVTAEAETMEMRDYEELSTADVIMILSRIHVGPARYRLLEVAKVRGHAFKEGPHGMDINSDGIVIYPRLATILPPDEPKRYDERQRFNLPELDLMLNGGLPRNTTTVVFGEPGTGKTMLSLHYLAAGASLGEKGLFVSFHETADELVHRAESLGIPLAHAVADGTVEIIRWTPIELHPDRLAWEISRRVLDGPVRRLVIDDVAEMVRAASVLGHEIDYLMAFFEFMRRVGTSVIMLQPGEINAGSYGAPISLYSTYNRILLRRVEYNAGWFRVLSVLSMQSSSHDASIREFRIQPDGIHILNLKQSDNTVLAEIAREHRSG
jgi:circadian clock protein KaiC